MHATIPRHRTAISRTELSRPVKLALTDGILRAGNTFFDYGCGLGDDQRLLSAGYSTGGWDPAHRPEATIAPANIVNLGFVVNVIENALERTEVVRRAWAITEDVLIVSARTTMDSQCLGETLEYADGLVTSRGTFQKFFEQSELRAWIDQTLSVNSVAAAPGVFYVFRDDQARAGFLASRFRRRIAVPRLARSVELFRSHEALLAPLMSFVSERGRVPNDDEVPNLADLQNVFGSIRKAFRIVIRATSAAQWDQIAEQRALDLLIYLALSRFDTRPAYGHLPRELQRDVKGFFSNYKQACENADELLFALRDQKLVESACQISEIGKLTPGALYVHESALDALSPLLRLYEGCARGYLGRIDGANLIKLHRREPQISYLSYPEFESDPHPAIASSTTVNLQTFRVTIRDFRSYRNPPILHRKELFVQRDHPHYVKFERLTRVEEQKGLYENPNFIGTRDGWNATLRMKGFALRGHRVLQTKVRGTPEYPAHKQDQRG
jgi:DNA phosphorothioation-associated putative methyltransferase